ncbi:MAG: lipid-A-disaccharide synthase [FCB group bacterium]|nr:lipid-A-disaccharide synthase [FCB group bacterium]
MNIFLIAGEPSGDQHGGLLMQALKQKCPEVRFKGIGGPEMRRAGLTSLVPLERMAVMGFVEILKHLNFFRDVKRKVISDLEADPPDRVILIDYPGFNLRIAKMVARRFEIPITYYISPQIWAWKEKRVEIIRKTVDQLLVIFPFEVDWYRQRGITARFVGHPFLDEWSPRGKAELRQTLGLKNHKPVLTLFPGSRHQELKRHLPLFLQVARQVKAQAADVQIVLGIAPHLQGEDLLKSYDLKDIIVLRKQSRLALETADAAIVASGTSTLEGAIFGTPMAVVYRLSPISWWLTRRLVKVPFAAMANLLAGKRIVPEFLQKAADPHAIAAEVIRQLTDKEYSTDMKAELKKVRESLGGAGASVNAALAILERHSSDEVHS